MKKTLITCLLTSFLMSLSTLSYAAVVSVEPDSFPNGTDISNSFPGVTLSTASGNPVFSITSTDTVASTGLRVFGATAVDDYWAGMPAAGTPDPYAAVGLSNSNSVLRVDFASPTSFVSIDIIPSDNSDPSVLAAYDAAGNLLDVFEIPAPNVQDVSVTASITRPTADIAFIIAGGRDGDTSNMDNLQYNSGSSASIPTLSQWGLLLLILILGIFGAKFARQRH